VFLGHQALINDVKFSPNGRLIASASFDKSVKLWDGTTGKYVHPSTPNFQNYLNLNQLPFRAVFNSTAGKMRKN